MRSTSWAGLQGIAGYKTGKPGQKGWHKRSTRRVVGRKGRNGKRKIRPVKKSVGGKERKKIKIHSGVRAGKKKRKIRIATGEGHGGDVVAGASNAKQKDALTYGMGGDVRNS